MGLYGESKNILVNKYFYFIFNSYVVNKVSKFFIEKEKILSNVVNLEADLIGFD